MVSAVELYAFVVGLVFLALLAAALRYERDAVKRRFERQLGVSWRWGMRTALLALAAVGVLFVLGALPVGGDPFQRRGRALAVVLPAALLVGGSVLLAGAAGNGRTLWSLLGAGTGPAEGTTGVVSGVARPVDTAGRTPFTDREALCWTWRAEVYDPNGIEGIATHSRLWEPRAAGTDGVSFRVETDDGAVRVDPTGASASLDGEQVVERDGGVGLADAPEAVREIEREYGEKPRRYADARLAPGRAVTVRGRVEPGGVGPEDGESGASERVLRGTENAPLRIVAGSRRVALRRYGLRGAAFLLAGALAIWLGGTWLVAVLGAA